MKNNAILEYGKGQPQQYAAERRQEAIEKMSAVMTAHAGVLIQGGFIEICARTESEFRGQIEVLKLAAREFDLRVDRRCIPAMIMVPDWQISVRSKLLMINASGDCDVDEYGQRYRISEPYVAINVTRMDMKRKEVQLAHCYAEQGAGPDRSVLTLGEVAMFALYYPKCFDGRVTAIVQPDRPEGNIALLAMSLCNDKPTFVLRECRADDLPDASFQVMACEVRVGR